MGKTKRNYNWKARKQSTVVIDHSEQKRIKLDLPNKESVDDVHTDVHDANTLVLPGTKRKTKSKEESKPRIKKLSKKEKKKLQRVLETKTKKAKRAEILDSLSHNQVSADESKLFSSIAEVYTGKSKTEVSVERTARGEVKLNTISGSRRKAKQTDVTDDVSEDSIDTSDISTDEDEEEVTLDKNQAEETVTQIQTDIEETVTQIQPDVEETVQTLTEPPPDVKKTCKEKRTPVVHIPVSRLPSMQELRLKLPILSEEQVIMETITAHPVTIVCGETGSGKTTQVPQFLYEAGYSQLVQENLVIASSGGAIIGVTEPRRVAAVSMSKRVAMEMNLTSRSVSYQIRYEGSVTSDTRIKFQTDGVLLKEVQKDFLLTKYSAIIVDEAHERSVFTDILIGLLSRIVPLRQKKGNPLKLVIMSATLRVEDFTQNSRLFKVTPPVIKVDSRQFPVTIHFNRRTPLAGDYLAEAFKKMCKIHRQLPSGGILVFVTGQQEVHTLCKKLRHAFPYTSAVKPRATKAELRRQRKSDKKARVVLPEVSLDSYSVSPLNEEEEREAAADSDQDIGADVYQDSDEDLNAGDSSNPMYVLPLYSLLSTDKQAMVFDPPPDGCRLCVVATNVAETSLTIPNIKYVIDTGKTKTKFYDKVTGVSTFRITWTSKASANQRAGRAGRVGPGHCYRLYSSAVFNDDFEEFAAPEILRRPVDDLILQMKDMNIDRVSNFPFPTPPDPEQLQAGERLLISLGALTPPVKDMKKETPSQITAMGRAMSCFPVSPRYSKMLALGHQRGLLPYVIAIVAALSVDEVFTEIQAAAATDTEKDSQKHRSSRMMQIKRLWAGEGNSLLLGDLMVLLKAVGSCEYEGFSTEFCNKFSLRYKAMAEIRKLRAQLTNTVNGILPDADLYIDPKLAPPTDSQAKFLRQITCAGLADHVARRAVAPASCSEAEGRRLKHAYYCMELEEPVYIHPSSVLHKQCPEFILYQNIHETSRLYMKGIVAVEPDWLPVFAPCQCTFSEPEDDPPPFYNAGTGEVFCYRASSFGRPSWPLPAVALEYPAGLHRYKWFARFILDGQVAPSLRDFVPVLLSSPATMVKTWAKLQPRTETLLSALMKKHVDCREALEEVWQHRPDYLLLEYLEWIPEAVHQQVQTKWPPLPIT